MTTLQRSSLFVLAVGVLLFGMAVAPAYGQAPLEEWAEQQISERTGIDPSLLATLLVSTDESQFILSFVFINEEVMQSNLRDELKDAIRPFLGQRAMMAMIVPTQQSVFQPTAISFAQSDASFLMSTSAIHPITEKFMSGPVPAQEVHAGVLELPQALDLGQAFTIQYQGEFQTTFSLQPGADNPTPAPQPGEDRGDFQGFFMALLQAILFFFLIPFLI